MKNLIYILFIVILATFSCGPTGDLASSREARTAMKQENVKKAVEAQEMIVKVQRLHTRRGRILEMNPDMNFVIINKDRTRISLGYIGRSFTTRPVAAINLQGQIYSRVIDTNKKGGYDIRLELGQESEKFTLNLSISRNGYVSMNITNPRIDLIRYSGTLEAL
ncbi:MAG: DUF4251 domain-containing protein [Bacteroidota bacterium]|nr:DUF4251 domain-containing protein [Bacteroidota bacterium]